MKTYKYTICHPSGEVETIRIPALFNAFDVAKRLKDYLVFLHVPKKSNMYLDYDAAGSPGGYTEGPVCVFVSSDEKTYWVPFPPRDDIDASRLWRNHVHVWHQGAAVSG